LSRAAAYGINFTGLIEESQMIRQQVAALALCLIGAVAPRAWALDWSVMLPEREVARLSADARAYYDRAWVQNDRINWDESVVLLSRAAEIDVDHAGLQFLVLSRSINRAEVYYSAGSFTDPASDFEDEAAKRLLSPPWQIRQIFLEEDRGVGDPLVYTTPPWKIAEVYFDLADGALARLDAMAGRLSREDRARVARARVELEKLRSTIAERDQRRAESGKPIMAEVQRLRMEFFKQTAPPDDPLNPFDQQFLKMSEGADQQATSGEKEDDEYNPFATLPGEYLDPVFPLPQLTAPMIQGIGTAPAFDEFGRPIAQPTAFGFDPSLPSTAQPVFGAPPAAPAAPPPGEFTGF
jgi:hypothetical protein